MTRKLKIQPSVQPDFQMPYPYYVDENGDVDGQDFWKGEPAGLLGFQNRFDVQQVDLLHQDFWLNPHLALGRYPVFAYKGGRIMVHQIAITEVRIVADDVPDGYPDGVVNRLGWAEAKPLGAHGGSIIGGDEQVGDGWLRRFVKRHEDDTWAVLDVTYYVAQPGLRIDDETDTRRNITRQLDYSVCHDPVDVAGSQIYSNIVYEVVRELAEDQDVELPHELCDEFDLHSITWDGHAVSEQE